MFFMLDNMVREQSILPHKMKIAIFGGTFNPIHNGHINLALQINQQFNFDKIMIIPTNKPPHKNSTELAENEHRLKMCQLATQDNSVFLVSDMEYKLGGVSYTINTIETIMLKNPNAEIYLLIGSDMFYTFDQWKSYKQILQKVNIITAARTNNEFEKMVVYKQAFKEYSEKINIISINVLEISSSQIRKNIKMNKSASDYLDLKVYEYIKKHNLYIE